VDKFEQLVSDSPLLAAVILGNPALTQFDLIAPETLSAETEADLQARGMGFIGVTGVVAGQFRCELAVPLDDAAVDAIAQAFIQHVVVKLSTKGDLASRILGHCRKAH
jgi:hypothetical protein